MFFHGRLMEMPKPSRCGSTPTLLGMGVCLMLACPSTHAQETLRAAADKRSFSIGAAVGGAFWTDEAPYRETLRKEFNILVAENVMKFAQLQPSRNVFAWTQADSLVKFARENGMRVRGHTLVWGNGSEWVEEGNFGRAELLAIMKTHIHTVMGRYRGKITEWDVVNEAIANGTGAEVYQNNFWLRGIGKDYVDSAFHYARQADSSALLFYNDYRAEGAVPKADKIFALVKGLRDKGAPIHGVGMQGHMSSPGTIRQVPPLSQIDANMKRLAAIGLKVSITEFDYRVRTPANAQDLDDQKAGYKSMLGVCLANPNCISFVTWGFTDKYSFIPGTDPGWGAGLPFDESYRPKPAYYGILESLQKPVGILPGRQDAPLGSRMKDGRSGGKWDVGGRRHSRTSSLIPYPR